MENLKIPDSSITASSMYDSNHAPHMGRLNNKKTQNGIGAWVVQQQGGVLDFNATTYPSLCFCGNTFIVISFRVLLYWFKPNVYLIEQRVSSQKLIVNQLIFSAFFVYLTI